MVFVIPLSDFAEVLQLVVVEVFPVAFCFESRSGERCYFESDVASAFPPFGLALIVSSARAAESAPIRALGSLRSIGILSVSVIILN